MVNWAVTPKTFSTGETITGWTLNTEIRDRLLALRNLNDYSARLIMPSTGQAIDDHSRTALNWGPLVFNNGTPPLWSSGSPSRITAPVTGWYHIGGIISWSTGSTAGLRYGELRKNGSDSSRYNILGTEPAGLSSRQTVGCYSETFYLSSGDYLEVLVLQTGGDEKPQTVQGSSQNGSWFWARLLGTTA